MKWKFKKVLALAASAAFVCANVMSVSAATLEDCFEEDYYADSYADLKAAFGNDKAALYNHYRTYGIGEGRQINRYFDVNAYRARYADLDAAFGDDWDAYYNHYLTYGLLEGRSALSSGETFSAEAYAALYPDLKEAFGNDVWALYNHYITYGISEGRLLSATAADDASDDDADAAENTDSTDDAVNTEQEGAVKDEDASGTDGDHSENGDTDDAYFKEWVEQLYESLIQDDHTTAIELLENFADVEEACAPYEYVGWAQFEYSVNYIEGGPTTITFNEIAYKLTASDGTVVGIVVFTDDSDSITNIHAFVAYSEDHGFDYVGAGDHYVGIHYRTGFYSYTEGNIVYIIVTEDFTDEMILDEKHVVSAWHVEEGNPDGLIGLYLGGV